MKTFYNYYRSLMTMMFITGSLLMNVDAFGQSCDMIQCATPSGCSGTSGASGACAFAAGSSAQATGDLSVSIGYKSNTGADSSLVFGNLLSTNTSSANNMVIGFGDSPSSPLHNSISNSIMIGVNSTEPTMFFEDAGGGSGIGRVGVGTTDPDGILHIQDENNTNTEVIIERGAANSGIIRFHQTGASTGYVRQYSTGLFEIANEDQGADLRMNVNVGGTPTTVLTLAGANGNFGVNTPTPGAPMDVRSTTGGNEEVIARFRVSDSSDEFFRIQNRSNDANEFSAWLEGASDEADNSSIELTGRVLANANTGAVPVVQFSARHINAATEITRPLFRWGTNTATSLMQMDNEGNLGIGTVNPLDLLHVNGGASKPSTNTWTIVSDENLKTDISPFTDGLDVLKEIDPIWFRYNGMGNLPVEPLTPGVLAQQVLSVAPYMIDSAEMVIDTVTNETMSVLTYNANALFYLLLNSVKELDERTENSSDLQSQIELLNDSYTQLQNEHNQLSQTISDCCSSGEASFKDDGQSENQKSTNSSLTVIPNPFRNQTVVSYTMDRPFTSGQLLVLDSSGKIVYQIPVLENHGSVVITSNDLAVGTYYCTLSADGKPVGSTRIVKVE